jgi:hypothetical protein
MRAYSIEEQGACSDVCALAASALPVQKWGWLLCRALTVSMPTVVDLRRAGCPPVVAVSWALCLSVALVLDVLVACTSRHRVSLSLACCCPTLRARVCV